MSVRVERRDIMLDDHSYTSRKTRIIPRYYISAKPLGTLERLADYGS
jgi:hypothetical protein